MAEVIISHTKEDGISDGDTINIAGEIFIASAKTNTGKYFLIGEKINETMNNLFAKMKKRFAKDNSIRFYIRGNEIRVQKNNSQYKTERGDSLMDS